MNSKLCYVTAFYDIDRDKWATFKRTFDEYFNAFTPLVDMFKNINSTNYELVIYIDKKHSKRVIDYCENIKNIKLIEINDDFLNKNSILWQRLKREKEIMESNVYKNMISHRLHFPENINPYYTLINHAKIDFVVYTLKNITDSEYLCWVDFGYFSNRENISKYPINIKLLANNKINYTLINQITNEDKDIFYTLRSAPEKIGGFFFYGNRKKLIEYQTLYHNIHEYFQTNNICDDDQHIVLQCYFNNPELFQLHYLGEWHKSLIHFQHKSLTEIMNKYGSDKGNGYHNYTEYYGEIFTPFRYKSINLLEIGIGTINPSIPSSMNGSKIERNYQPGSSLRGWREFFPNAQIFGCDIDTDILFTDERIDTFYIDQTNSNVINTQICNVDRFYNVIIDNGLYHFSTNWNMLKQIINKLAPSGIYIIEDIKNFDKNIFEEQIYNEMILKGYEISYIEIPNKKNTCDNNIFIIKK
jgi:SAM-dependent methyltransferase